MQHFLVLSDASEATLRHWGNIYKLYRLYIFLREGHHFVLYVLNGEATLWHKLHKLYSFLTVNQQTNKCCFQKQQQPNHAWGSVWLFYDLQCISGRQQWGQFGVAVFYSGANHIHSVWVRCPGMNICSPGHWRQTQPLLQSNRADVWRLSLSLRPRREESPTQSKVGVMAIPGHRTLTLCMWLALL